MNDEKNMENKMVKCMKMREVFYSLKGHIFRKYGRCGITNLKVQQQFCLSGTLLLASTMEIIDKRYSASNQNYKLKNNVFSAKYGCNLVQRPMRMLACAVTAVPTAHFYNLTKLIIIIKHSD
jgi:hypothetical protein